MKLIKLKRKFELRDLINIIAVIALLSFFAWVFINYTRAFPKATGGDLISSAENLKQFILSYGKISVALIIFLHALQVVISFIPSAAAQFAAGLIFGMTGGMLTGFIGISIGSAISFYMSRIFGKRLLTLFLSEKKINEIEALAASDISATVLFALFILPTPKDFLPYLAGLTSMKASKFFLISAIGRIPGMLVATYLGAYIFNRNYVLIFGVTAICGISFMLLYIFRNKIWKLISRR